LSPTPYVEVAEHVFDLGVAALVGLQPQGVPARSVTTPW
jgi:hypothetical protein